MLEGEVGRTYFEVCLSHLTIGHASFRDGVQFLLLARQVVESGGMVAPRSAHYLHSFKYQGLLNLVVYDVSYSTMVFIAPCRRRHILLVPSLTALHTSFHTVAGVTSRAATRSYGLERRSARQPRRRGEPHDAARPACGRS